MSPDATPHQFRAAVGDAIYIGHKLLLDSGEFEEIMDRCMAAAEWSSFPERRTQSERNDRLRGIGMAMYTERCGGGFPETCHRRAGDLADTEVADDVALEHHDLGLGVGTVHDRVGGPWSRHQFSMG